MDTKKIERQRVAAVVRAYGRLRDAQDALRRQDFGQARQAVAAGLDSLARLEIPTDL